ncbi:hypothetical protein AJ80_09245 [Polytolypa hystricis UAMH7299]|uniref:Uncharacterized protein n=1 Tax=Polytolypa hystricis (strain UAMH7299) TaxID=1447883 RepID=A0A2B7WU66_POLH7|nr:hypothetical protein AJ80_09245 [Polytolypa hystricis UAMH7299]
MPGNVFYTALIESIYSINVASSSATVSYTGESDASLSEKWRELSGNEKGVALALNLVWTDLSANSLVRTRGWLSEPRPRVAKRSTDIHRRSETTTNVPVASASRRI